jgi:hypothetical protein
MYLNRFARRQIVRDDFAAELDPCVAASLEMLQDETVPAEDAGAELFLKAHR